MRHARSSLSLLTLTATLAACAPGEATERQTAGPDQPAAGLSCYVARGTETEALERPSPLTRTPFEFDGGDGVLCYGAPSARGRAVMGGLVPWGAPWRAGANEPTTIHLSAPATIGGVAVEPGSYSIYTIPGEEAWEVVVNGAWERWGIPISPEVRAADVGSFTVTPEPTDEAVETMRYTFEPTGSGGELVLAWESTRIRIPVGGSAG